MFLSWMFMEKSNFWDFFPLFSKKSHEKNKKNKKKIQNFIIL